MLDCDTSTALYHHLLYNINWIDGIPSKNSFTRKVMNELKLENIILGVYLNYYVDGKMWTPNYSHPKQKQIIISLGTTRKLFIAKKQYNSANGDVIIFGSSIHGVQKEPEITGGRISIAIFMLS